MELSEAEQRYADQVRAQQIQKEAVYHYQRFLALCGAANQSLAKSTK